MSRGVTRTTASICAIRWNYVLPVGRNDVGGTSTIYYKNHSDKWLIQFPAKVYLRRKNGTYYIREEYLPSTSLVLGEISFTSTMKKAQQKSEARQRADDFLANAPRVGVPIAPDAGPGEIILLAGYESWLYDPDRPILYDQQ